MPFNVHIGAWISINSLGLENGSMNQCWPIFFLKYWLGSFFLKMFLGDHMCYQFFKNGNWACYQIINW